MLREQWPDPDYDPDEYLTAALSPFTDGFPGLAPAVAEDLPEEAIMAALDQFEPVYIGLIEAARPADAITVTGWGPTDAWEDREPVSAVLRSWEDRFGARLIQAGPGVELRLLVEHPPRTLAQALPVAAELFAFGDDWFDEARNNRSAIREVNEIAQRLVNSPIWGFWWD